MVLRPKKEAFHKFVLWSQLAALGVSGFYLYNRKYFKSTEESEDRKR